MQQTQRRFRGFLAPATAALALLGAALPGAALPGAAANVAVRPSATVEGREIRLSDISDARGALGEIVLGAAALPGRSCTLSPGDIRLRLRAAHVNVDLVSLPAVVTVATRGAVISSGVLLAAAIEAVRKALPWPAGDVTLEPVAVPRLPAFRGSGTPIVTAGAPVLLSARTATVPLTVSVPGAPASETRTLEVTLRISVSALAVVAQRAIARHALIGPGDVALARMIIGGEAVLANTAAVLGKRATGVVPAGRALAASDVEEAPVLPANAPVTVRVVSGDVEVTTTGTAREEGCIGQTIRIHLDADPNRPGPARDVRARVADAQTVIMEE